MSGLAVTFMLAVVALASVVGGFVVGFLVALAMSLEMERREKVGKGAK